MRPLVVFLTSHLQTFFPAAAGTSTPFCAKSGAQWGPRRLRSIHIYVSVVATVTVQSGCRFLSPLQAHGCTLEISCGQVRVLTMALQAPAHGERRKLLYPVHGLHRPVAALAGHT